jgi:hypothetical protein
MKIVSINFLNIVEQIDKVSLIHGLTLDDLKIVNETPYKIDFQKIHKAVNIVQSVLNCTAPAELWLFGGELAKFILNGLPIHGCTLIESREPIISLTYYENMDLLIRVLFHELLHSHRIYHLGIKSQSEYVRYINNFLNYLYEELLAVSFEKYFNPGLSLEDIIGFNYNPQWRNWLNSGTLGDFEFKYLLEEDSFNEYMKTHLNNLPSIIYFLVYRICSETSIVEQIINYINTPSKNGFRLLISEF